MDPLNIPSTFIFESKDKTILPLPLLVVFIKNLFRYGRKDVKVVNNTVHLYLSYCPRTETVQKKVKNLPVKYLRVAADDEEELQLFIDGMQRFPNVNFGLEEEEAELEQTEGPQKKKIKVLENLTLRPPQLSATNQINLTDGNSVEEEKTKLLEKRMIRPLQQQGKKRQQPVVSGPSSLIEIMDEDQDEYEAQKYNVYTRK